MTAEREQSRCVHVMDYYELHRLSASGAQMAPLFVGLVGAYEHRGRHVETEHLGGLAIDHRFVLGGRLALEDANRRSRRRGSGGESGH
jgi:hypothetical protein